MVQMEQRAVLGLLFIGAWAGNLGGADVGIGRRWLRPVPTARRGTSSRVAYPLVRPQLLGLPERAKAGM